MMEGKCGGDRVLPPAKAAWAEDERKIPLHFRRAWYSNDLEEEDSDLECVDLFEWLPNRVRCGVKGQVPAYLFQPREKRRGKEKGRHVNEIWVEVEDIPSLDDTEETQEEKEVEKEVFVKRGGDGGGEEGKTAKMYPVVVGLLEKERKKWEVWQMEGITRDKEEEGVPEEGSKALDLGAGGWNWKEVIEKMRRRFAHPKSVDKAVQTGRVDVWQLWQYPDSGGMDLEVMRGHEYEMAVIGAYRGSG